MFLQTVCFIEFTLHPSQRYVRSPVCTQWCTIRLYVLLNVLLSTPHDMYIPQCVSYVKKKKGSNIDILKRGKNIMKCGLHITYTNIISADLCSLSISINSFKPNDFLKCHTASPLNCWTTYKMLQTVCQSLEEFCTVLFGKLLWLAMLQEPWRSGFHLGARMYPSTS